MRLRHYLASFFVVVSNSFFHSRAMAQASDAFEFVCADWHLAGISENQNDWATASSYYQKVLQESLPLPLDVREWYRGTAFYGIARCACRSGKDSTAVRSALSKAFAHHFWNFALLQDDSVMLACSGRQWLDSESLIWIGVLNDERPLWREQTPIIFYPAGYDSTARWPLLIALHGGNGNYESFAEHWRGMANDLRAVIVIPAGVFRESQITNSWGSDMSLVEKPVMNLVKEFTSKHLADPSQVYLTGFSQGAQAAIELTVLRPDIFRGAIAMSGFVDRPISGSVLRKARERGVRLYAISGEYEDPIFHNEIDTFHTRCTQASIPFELKVLPGMIHEVPLDFHSQFLQAWNWVRPSSQAARQGEE
jgi:predicted esterase